MGEKQNTRVAHTKQMVRQSLLGLLQTKSIYKISIRELCEKAGVNRSTFYNHYGSQYDVLAEMETAYLAEIAQTIAAANVRDTQSVLQRVTLVLRFVQDNLALSRMLMNNNLDNTFSERLFSLPKIEEMLNEALAGMEDEDEKTAVVSFAIHGSYKILRDWIDAETRCPPAKQAKRILALAGRVCNGTG